MNSITTTLVLAAAAIVISNILAASISMVTKKGKSSPSSSKVSHAEKARRGEKQYGVDVEQVGNAWKGFGGDLPDTIMVEILARLPIRSILLCRGVCKAWRDLILDPIFGKVQHQKSLAQPHHHHQLLLRAQASSTLFLVETEVLLPDLDSAFNNNLDLDNHVHLNLVTKLDQLRIVNSCNGLLCLSWPARNKYNPVMVCNPLTGEFLNIPQASQLNRSFFDADISECERLRCGLGFNPKTNQYKVVRLSKGWVKDSYSGVNRYYSHITEVYTLGKGSWKVAGLGQRRGWWPTKKYPTCLNGAIHWFCYGYGHCCSILSFDLETELFNSLPLPHYYEPGKFGRSHFKNMSIGVLRDYLCLCDHSRLGVIDIWVRINNNINDGIQGSWINMFTIDEADQLSRLPPGLCQVIKCYENGAVLIFHSGNRLIYYNPEKQTRRVIDIVGSTSNYEAFAHVPSLVSLKDVLVGNEIKTPDYMS